MVSAQRASVLCASHCTGCSQASHKLTTQPFLDLWGDETKEVSPSGSSNLTSAAPAPEVSADLKCSSSHASQSPILGVESPIGRPPKQLSPVAKAVWKRIATVAHWLTEAHRDALEVYCGLKAEAQTNLLRIKAGDPGDSSPRPLHAGR